MRVIVAAVLACREPLAFAAASSAATTLIARGPAAVVEFCWAGAVAALAMAAAWALLTHAPAGVPLARAAVVAGALRDVQVLCWTALPSNIIPGTRLTIGLLTIGGYALLWIAARAVALREQRS